MKRSRGSLLIEGTDPARTESRGYRRQEEVLGSSSRILKAVEVSAPISVSTRRSLGVSADDNHHWGLTQEPLAKRGLGQGMLDAAVSHHVEVPGLAVARGGSTNGSLKEPGHSLRGDVAPLVKSPHTVSGFQSLPEVQRQILPSSARRRPRPGTSHGR